MAFINWDEYIEKTKPLKEDWFEPEEVGEECFPEVSTFKITNSTIECVMVFDDYGDDLLCVKVIVPYQRQDGKVIIDASNASGLFVDSENHNLYIMADDIAADFDLNDTEAIISEAINNFILTYNNPEVGDSFADKFGCEVLVESCDDTASESIDESIPNSFGTLDLVDLQRNHKEDYNSVKNSEEMKNIIDDFLDQIGRYSQTKEYDKYGLSKLSADLTTASNDLQTVINTIVDKYKK